MKYTFVYLLALLPLAGLAQSQTTSQSEALWRAGVSPDETNAVLTQLTGNVAPASAASEIGISQAGANNRVSLSGTVSNNSLRLTQTGDSNLLNLELSGEQNSFGLSQVGSGNVLDLRKVQATGERLDILQQGNNNRLTSDGYPVATGVPIRIQQSGGMQLQITNVR